MKLIYISDGIQTVAELYNDFGKVTQCILNLIFNRPAYKQVSRLSRALAVYYNCKGTLGDEMRLELVFQRKTEKY